jgi:hypothetical protein
MPNCFSLTRGGENAPTNLLAVDKEIAEYMGMEPDEKFWCCGWYDAIGLSIAMGYDLNHVIKLFKECPDIVKIAKYLRKNFAVDCWYEAK